jgi:two-component system chemotaxis response regulator CheB
MVEETLKIVTVDDMLTYRIILSSLLRKIPGVKVVGSASNGKEALKKIESLRPDLITLDVEMPVMDGLKTLEEVKKNWPETGVIMVSGANKKNADITVTALQKGALSFIVKPDATSTDEAKEYLLTSLRKEIGAFLEGLRKLRQGKKTGARRSRRPMDRPTPKRLRSHTSPPKNPEVVALGISTGGPKALSDVIPKLPGNLPFPIVLVQHMPPLFTKSLADSLDRKSALKVKEAEKGETIEPGTVYIAPGGHHMVVKKIGARRIIDLNSNPPEHGCRPAVDVLFRSVAAAFEPKRTITVVMTGMGDDGCQGAAMLKRKGAYCIAQNEESCVVYGMPRCLVDKGIAHEVLDLPEIPQAISKLAGGG